MGQMRGMAVANNGIHNPITGFSRPLFLNDGRVAWVPMLQIDDLDIGIVILDPTAGPGQGASEEFFGESNISPFGATSFTDIDDVSMGQWVIYVPAVDQIWRLGYADEDPAGPGNVTRYFEATIFDIASMTMARDDLGVTVFTGSSTARSSRSWGDSGIGVSGDTIFALRPNPRVETGTGALLNDQDALVVDCTAVTSTIVTCGLGANKRNARWGYGVVGVDSDVHFAPQQVFAGAPVDSTLPGLIIDPSGPTFTAHNFGTSVSGPGTAWENIGFVDEDDRLWARPFGQTTWLIVDMAAHTSTATTFGLSAGDVAAKFPGLGSDGMVYLLGELADDPVIIQVDPSTLDGVILDVSDYEAPSAGTDRSAPVITSEGNAFQFMIGGSGDSSAFRMAGWRPLVGRDPVSPPANGPDNGAVGIVVRSGRPLRAEPFLWYDTAGWDGGWTLPNLGSAGADFDLNVVADASVALAGTVTNWRVVGGLPGGATGAGDSSSPGGTAAVVPNDDVDMFDGPLLGEPFTVMVAFGAPTSSQEDTWRVRIFPLDAASDHVPQLTWLVTANLDVGAEDKQIEIDTSTSSAGLLDASDEEDVLLVLSFHPRLGGSSGIVRTASGQTWSWDLSQNAATIAADYSSLSSAIGYIAIETSGRRDVAAFPTSMIGEAWSWARQFAVFRGEPSAADVDDWYDVFFPP